MENFECDAYDKLWNGIRDRLAILSHEKFAQEKQPLEKISGKKTEETMRVKKQQKIRDIFEIGSRSRKIK